MLVLYSTLEDATDLKGKLTRVLRTMNCQAHFTCRQFMRIMPLAKQYESISTE